VKIIERGNQQLQYIYLKLVKFIKDIKKLQASHIEQSVCSGDRAYHPPTQQLLAIPKAN
jgi:hypothetical protein